MTMPAASVLVSSDQANDMEKDFRENLLEKFFFMVGPARAGTTAISRVTGANPRIFYAKIKMGLLGHWAGPGRDKHSLDDLRIPIDRFYENIEASWVDDLKARLDAACERKDFRETLTLNAIGQFILFSEGQSARDFDLWMMKSNSDLGWQLLKDSFPEARFCFIVRNPHSTVLSQAIRVDRRKNGAEAEHTFVSIARASRYWRHFAGQVLEWLPRFPKDTILVRYENFIDDPDLEIQRISEFTTGRKLDESILKQILGELKGVSTNTKEVYAGVSSASLNRWASKMNLFEIAVTSSFANSPAKRLGYRRTGSSYEVSRQTN
ncbi:MAG: sulfotransferase [Rhodospirillaceae bacterium]|nr:sulfotransferase [Rhodospirillaceae bacterium]